MIRAILTLLLLFPMLGLNAEQLEFNRIKQGDQTLLSWVWKDAQGEQHYLKSSINTSVLAKASRGVTTFNPQHYNNYQVKMAKKAEVQLPAGIHLRLIHSGHTYQAKLTGSRSDAKALAQAQSQFRRFLEQSRDQYLSERRLIQFQNAYGQQLIIPDHIYFTLSEIRPLYPLLENLQKQVRLLSPHQIIERVLSFVQSIPDEVYDEKGTSYRSPLSALVDNRADVASKATLAAALIRGIFPRRPIALMYMQEHIMLGVQINYNFPGKTYYDGKQEWICAEVKGSKGDKPITLGKVAQQTESHLKARTIVLARIP